MLFYEGLENGGAWEGQQHPPPPGSLLLSTTSTPEMISFNFAGWRRPGNIPQLEMQRGRQRKVPVSCVPVSCVSRTWLGVDHPWNTLSQALENLQGSFLHSPYWPSLNRTLASVAAQTDPEGRCESCLEGSG